VKPGGFTRSRPGLKTGLVWKQGCRTRPKGFPPLASKLNKRWKGSISKDGYTAFSLLLAPGNMHVYNTYTDRSSVRWNDHILKCYGITVCTSSEIESALPIAMPHACLFLVQYNADAHNTHLHSPLWIHVRKPYPYEHLRRTGPADLKIPEVTIGLPLNA